MRAFWSESVAESRPAVGPLLAVDLGTARTKISDISEVLLDEPTLFSRDRAGASCAGWGAWVASEENRRGTVLHHPVRDALVTDPGLAVEFLRTLVPEFWRPMWGTAAVAIPAAATAQEARVLAAVASTALGAIVVPVDALAAGALGAGLPVDDPAGVLMCDVGVGIVEVGIVRADRGGGARLSARASANVGVRVYEEDPERFVDTTRTALRLVLAQDPYARDGITPKRVLHLVGGGALLPGVVEHLSQALQLQVTVPVGPRHAVLRGLGRCLERMAGSP